MPWGGYRWHQMVTRSEELEKWLDEVGLCGNMWIMLEPATQKDGAASATDIRVRLSRAAGRTLRKIAVLKRWKQKTAAEVAINHFAKSLGISTGPRRASSADADTS